MNSNYLVSSLSIREALEHAYSRNANEFNIIISSKTATKGLPREHPKKVQEEILGKLTKNEKDFNLKYIKGNNIILSTKKPSCAADFASITTFFNEEVNANVIWENITARILIFDISTKVSLEEFQSEVERVNEGIKIRELRRFVKKGAKQDSAPILITILGKKVPDRIKHWDTSDKVKLFIDRPRQCEKCFQYDHATAKCEEKSQTCFKCGEKHSFTECTIAITQCFFCKGNHYANDKKNNKECTKFKEEQHILEVKCNNHLTISEARRVVINNKRDSFAARCSSNSEIQEDVKDLKSYISVLNSNINKNNKILELLAKKLGIDETENEEKLTNPIGLSNVPKPMKNIGNFIKLSTNTEKKKNVSELEQSHKGKKTKTTNEESKEENLVEMTNTEDFLSSNEDL